MRHFVRHVVVRNALSRCNAEARSNRLTVLQYEFILRNCAGSETMSGGHAVFHLNHSSAGEREFESRRSIVLDDGNVVLRINDDRIVFNQRNWLKYSRHKR